MAKGKRRRGKGDGKKRRTEPADRGTRPGAGRGSSRSRPSKAGGDRDRSAPTKAPRSFLILDLGRSDLLHAGALGGLAFLLYALTACRTIYTGDSAELAAAAASFGVPHPPGYPLYTLVTGLWVHALFFLGPAFASNLMSAAYAALSAGLLWLWLRRLGLGRAMCWFSSIALSVGATFWSQALVAEVYAFDVLLLVLFLNLLTRACKNPTAAAWTLAGLGMGLWLGHRFINAVYLPAAVLGYLAWRRRSGTPLKTRALLAGLGISILPFVYLPLASAADPPIDIGDPESWERLWMVLTGEPYRRHLETGNATLAAGRLGDFFLGLPRECGPAFALAPIGFWALWNRRSPEKRMAPFLALFVVSNLVLALPYNIVDIGSFFLPAYLALCALAGFGGEEVLARWKPKIVNARAGKVATVGMVVLSALALPWNARRNDLRAHSYAYDMGISLLESAGEKSLLFVHGDTVTHVLWYLQAIENRQPGTLMISTGHMNAWYTEQLAARRPDEPWPDFVPGSRPEAHAYKILSRLGPGRRVVFGFSPASVVRLEPQGGPWSRTKVAPRGMLLELTSPAVPADLAARASASARFWERALERLRPLRASVDTETKTIYLDYALSLQRHAEYFEQKGNPGLAVKFYRSVLELTPEEWEREVSRILSKVGRETPRLGLEERAATALRRLSTPAGPPEKGRP